MVAAHQYERFFRGEQLDAFIDEAPERRLFVVVVIHHVADVENHIGAADAGLVQQAAQFIGLLMHVAQRDERAGGRFRIRSREAAPGRDDAVAERHFVRLEVGDLLRTEPVLVTGVRPEVFDANHVERVVGVAQAVPDGVVSFGFSAVRFHFHPRKAFVAGRKDECDRVFGEFLQIWAVVERVRLRRRGI